MTSVFDSPSAARSTPPSSCVPNAVALASSTRPRGFAMTARSEEHTSELQSRSDLVCRLLLEKKKHTRRRNHQRPQPQPILPHRPPPQTPPRLESPPNHPRHLHVDHHIATHPHHHARHPPHLHRL